MAAKTQSNDTALSTGFDLGTWNDEFIGNQNSGIEVNIKHPETGDPVGWRWKVVGADSDKFRKAMNRLRNKRMKNQSKRMTAEQIEEENLEQLAAGVIGWSFDEGFSIHGKQPKCDDENVIHFLKTMRFIQPQIDAAIGDRSAFLPKSENS